MLEKVPTKSIFFVEWTMSISFDAWTYSQTAHEQ